MKQKDENAPDPSELTDHGVEIAAEKGTTWEEVEKLVHQMATEGQKPGQAGLVSDIFRSAVKLAKDAPGTLNLKIAATTLRELRFSFKTFSSHRSNPKITMFGSARVPVGTEAYNLAKAFAAEAVKRKFMIITGGGPGIMQAGNEGAENQGGFGLNIKLPFEQTANPFIDAKGRLINYKYFFTRKLFLVKEASAFAFFPGGFGTFDEAFEVLTLLQTCKTNIIPIVLVEPAGYGFWTEWEKFLKEVVLKKGFVAASDFNLMKIIHTPKEAIDHIEHFYKVFHSMRFVRHLSVLRLKKAPTAEVMKKINSMQEFKHLSMGEEIKLSKALPEEGNEPDIADLPRLVLPFDRKDIGSLRKLIDFMNDHA